MFRSVRIKPGIRTFLKENYVQTLDDAVKRADIWAAAHRAYPRHTPQLDIRSRHIHLQLLPTKLLAYVLHRPGSLPHPSGVTIVGSQDTFDLDVPKIQLCSGLVALLNQTKEDWTPSSDTMLPSLSLKVMLMLFVLQSSSVVFCLVMWKE
ncbi:uncharacterized protein LOC123503750 [Portunus trituberculatus]|uniref:uncharacterized protein LOC123503750 n=1 Tax=Portunus trituberculatus TaxID=210409 RepID=UPI001E1CD020|nr:uncharacterized protein LOC123503750 [Portunus trituberculatus]